jgi:hypothetical protein
MRRTRNSAYLERALLAASVGIIVFIIVFGGPRSSSIGPETGIAMDFAKVPPKLASPFAVQGAVGPLDITLMRSDVEPRVGASE